MRVPSAVVGVLWGAFALAPASCRQVAGIDDRTVASAPDASDGATAPDLSSLACGAMPGFSAGDDDACRACLAASCCGEIAACNADADCSAAITCTDGCAASDDPGCAARCDADHAGSRPLSAAALACRVRACAEPCGDAARCGRPPGPTDDCTACLDESCCSGEQASYAVAATRELRSCLDACTHGDTGCESQCFTARPGAFSQLAGMYACAKQACPAACWTATGAECGAYGGNDGNPCGQCVISNCCDEAFACDSTPGCNALNTCLYSCTGSNTCADACLGDASVDDVARFNTVIACRNLACAAECGAPTGGQCGFNVDPPACLDCLNANCCSEGLATAGDFQSIAYQGCANACTTATCETDCGKRYPQGQQNTAQVTRCAVTHCGDACFPTNLDAGSN